MTQHGAAPRGRDLIERWSALAERRLAYLTELFESGRWRRFHSEAAFLENIREAKIAVERWRRLASQEAGLDNQARNWSWLDRASDIPLYQGSVLHEEPKQSATAPAVAAVKVEALGPSPVMQRVMAAMATAMAPANEPTIASESADASWRHALDPIVLTDRYPILRSTV